MSAVPMDYEKICEAVQGINCCARNLRLANCIGTDRAEKLESQAKDVLELLETVTLPQAMALICQLALDCIGLTKVVDLELASQMMDCFDQSGLVVWGFSVEVAEVIALSLAAIAALLEIGHHDMTVPSHRYAKRSMITPYLEPVAADLDVISPQVYAALCRFELQDDSTAEERHLVYAFQQICIWILTILYRFEGSNSIEATNLWDWAGGDPHWSMVLGKGVLTFQQVEDHHPPEDVTVTSLPVPEELLELKDAVLVALCGLHTPDIAFGGELEADLIADDLGGGFSMAERLVGSDLHRSRLAQAAVDANLVTAAVSHVSTTQQLHCIAALLSFLAALMKPVQSTAAAWKEVIDGDPSDMDTRISNKVDAEGVLDAFVEDISVHRHSLWAIICFSEPKTRSFLQDAAYVSAKVAPPVELCRIALARWATICSDMAQLAALILLAANSGLLPEDLNDLAIRLEILSSQQSEEVTERMARTRVPMRLPEKWEAWYQFMSRSRVKPDVETREVVPAPAPPAPPAPPGPPAPETEKSKEPKKKTQSSLRDIIREAPKDLCCALDGKLLMDPVRSPYGHVFERSILMKALEKRASCPLTFQPLSLSDCQRDGEIRLRATRWVRLAVPPK